MSYWEQIISYESLLSAHKRARLSKQHKREVIEFELQLSKNLWALHYDLKYKRYQISGYRKFMIYDPKKREIQAISYRDRIVQHSLCDNFLTPLLEKHYINANCACRRGKGTDYAIKLLRKFMATEYKRCGKSFYFVKLDIKKFFPSIDHTILKQKLCRFVKDENIRHLLYIVIDSYGGKEALPMGNQSSQNFALLYLNRIDHFIKEKLRIKFYVRYMDDMVMLVENKHIAKEILRTVCFEIKKEKLILNPKSCISYAACGIEFLGWRFCFGKNGRIIQKVKNNSKKRIFTKIKILQKQFSLNKKQGEEIDCSCASYKGHLLRGNGWNIYKKIKYSF